MSVNFDALQTRHNAFTAHDSTRATYSPENFKTLLLQKHPFPPNLIVAGNLDISYCTGITSLPEGLTVQGSLDLCGCTGITSLPEGLTVGGNLSLARCTELTSLPKGLTVQGNLVLSHCTGLTSLPEGLTVEGNLGLSHCTGITSLPNWITTLGPRADGSMRHIHLDRTGLSETLLNRLRETPAPGIQFHFSS